MQIRYLRPVPFTSADPVVTRVYAELEQEFGVLAPPVALHAPASELLAAVWVLLRESLLVDGVVPRSMKEAVAVAVSESNTCPYCVTIHSAMLGSLTPTATSGGADDSAGAGPDGSDPALREVRQWARTGRPVSGAGPATTAVTAGQAPELVAVVVLMNYLNRMVNVFLGDLPLPPQAPAGALRMVGPMLTWLQRAAQARAAVAGTSLDLLPEADPATAARGAAAGPVLATAFARSARAFANGGERSVPPRVREQLRERLAGWDGSAPGPSRAWVEDAVTGLPDEDRAAGRLALLVAFASYQVDADAVQDFRTGNPDDVALLELVAWAAMTTALEIGAWMPIASPPQAPTDH